MAGIGIMLLRHSARVLAFFPLDCVSSNRVSSSGTDINKYADLEMGRLLSLLKKELLEMLPPTIFFFAVFQVIVVLRTVMDSGLNISMASTSAAFIGALIVGKSVLIANALPLFRWFSRKRLIVNVIWRVCLYLMFVLAFQLLEELIPLIRKYDSIREGLARLSEEGDWLVFWATHLFLAVFLSLYSFITALISLAGQDRVKDAMLGRSVGG